MGLDVLSLVCWVSVLLSCFFLQRSFLGTPSRLSKLESLKLGSENRSVKH